MHLNADISCALQQIESVKRSIDESGDARLQAQTAESMAAILYILQDPVFRTIVHVQDSLSELNAQLAQHPSMLPNDFDIDTSGNLVLSVNGDDVMYEYDDHLPSSINSLSGGTQSPEIQEKSLISPDMDDGGVGQQLSRHSKMPSLSGMELFPSTDFVQVQAIELVNDGTGLGFGIIGAKTSGVIVKTILPGGVADRDGRLQSGDHILQIGDVNLQEMVSEQVAAVLRQSGTHVRLVVGRAVDKTVSSGLSLEDGGSAVVPASVLVNRTELEKYLIASGYPDIFGECAAQSPLSTGVLGSEDEHYIFGGATNSQHSVPTMNLIETLDLPETEIFHVELAKDLNGLGITIAGYVCEKEELSGIFVKSVSAGSAADLNGRIRINDRIIEVDGQSLQGFSNHQAVELLKKSGHVVNLRLERYLRGPKYEQLQQAIAANDKISGTAMIQAARTFVPSPVPPPVSEMGLPAHKVSNNAGAAAPFFLIEDAASSANNEIAANSELTTFALPSNDFNGNLSSNTPLSSTDTIKQLLNKEEKNQLANIANSDIEQPADKYQKFSLGNITAEIEEEIICKWRKILGPGMEVITARIKKFPVGGLGISLEGTVDVEGGREVRPHHYVRSILDKGPVGLSGKLQAGDELLEVNGERLYGMNHLEVVAILKELPLDVFMVCARGGNSDLLLPMSSLDSSTIGGNVSGGAFRHLNNNFDNLVPIGSDRLVKAKSDGNLATTLSVSNDEAFKLKSRSLEPLTGLAMWSSEPQIIELLKGDRGLGFSILDYQDPMDSNDCLIVIRSLVPGGVAQIDGRLIPGDRLLFVNNINLENATLDQAVQALKGAPKGIVRIGVAKPLPMTDTSLKMPSISALAGTERASGTMDSGNFHRLSTGGSEDGFLPSSDSEILNNSNHSSNKNL